MTRSSNAGPARIDPAVAAELERRVAESEARLREELSERVRPLGDVLAKIADELEVVKAQGGGPGGVPGGGPGGPAPAEDPSVAIQEQMARFAQQKLRMKEQAIQARMTEMQTKGAKL